MANQKKYKKTLYEQILENGKLRHYTTLFHEELSDTSYTLEEYILWIESFKEKGKEKGYSDGIEVVFEKSYGMYRGDSDYVYLIIRAYKFESDEDFEKRLNQYKPAYLRALKKRENNN